MLLLRSMTLLLLATLGLTAQAHARFEPVVCKVNLTQAAEIQQGQQYAAKIYQQMPVLADNDPVTRYVQQLGARLVQVAPYTPGMQQQWPFNFHVVASSEVNAFALPGGAIFINLGTVQVAETEAQLAGVMAHEMSHVIMRHSVCNLKSQQRKGIFYALGQLGAAVMLGDSSAGQLATQGLGTAQGLQFLHMSRGDEQQADLLGINIMYDAGYDPRGLPQFFEIIQQKYGAGGSQFLSDHPNPGNRQVYAKAEIATLLPQSTPLVTTPAFTRAHVIAVKEEALTATQIKAGAWRGSTLYSTGPAQN